MFVVHIKQQSLHSSPGVHCVGYPYPNGPWQCECHCLTVVNMYRVRGVSTQDVKSCLFTPNIRGDHSIIVIDANVFNYYHKLIAEFNNILSACGCYPMSCL